MADDRISEERAAAALERAAQLQLEAAERVERDTPETDIGHPDGYARDELVAAASEAGIEPRFVELALREQSAAPATTDNDSDTALRRWLGTRRRSMSVSRVMDADLRTTVAASCRVFESDKYRLELQGVEEPIGSTQGGVLSFRMPRLRQLSAATGGYTSLAYRLEQLEMWQLHVLFREIGDRTEVVIVGDLRPGAHANLKMARVGGVLGAGLGGGAGVLVGASLGLAASVVFPVLGLGAAGVGAMALAYRGLYRSVLRKTESEIARMLGTVAGELSKRALLGLPSGS